MSGWIKLHRQFTEWEWYDDNNTKSLFLHLLIKANHKASVWRGQKIERGQILTGVNKLSQETGLSVQQIRTCLKKLKSTSEITSKATSKFSIITLCKYGSYQDEKEEDNSQINKQSNFEITNEQQTSNKQVTTSKNVKKNKNEKNEDKKEIKRTAPKTEPLDFSSISSLNIIKSVESYRDHMKSLGVKFKKSPTGWKRFIKKVSNFETLYGETITIECVQRSEDSNWKDIFKPKEEANLFNNGVEEDFGTRKLRELYEK